MFTNEGKADLLSVSLCWSWTIKRMHTGSEKERRRRSISSNVWYSFMLAPESLWGLGWHKVQHAQKIIISNMKDFRRKPPDRQSCRRSCSRCQCKGVSKNFVLRLCDEHKPVWVRNTVVKYSWNKPCRSPCSQFSLLLSLSHYITDLLQWTFSKCHSSAQLLHLKFTVAVFTWTRCS